MILRELFANQILINGGSVEGKNFIQYWNQATKPLVKPFSLDSEIVIDSIQQLLVDDNFKKLTDIQKGQILSLPNDRGNTPLQELALVRLPSMWGRFSEIEQLLLSLLSYPISIIHEKDPIWIQSWVETRVGQVDATRSSQDGYRYPLNKRICEIIPQSMLDEFYTKGLHNTLIEPIVLENLPNPRQLWTLWTDRDIKLEYIFFKHLFNTRFAGTTQITSYVGAFFNKDFYSLNPYSTQHILHLLISRIIKDKDVETQEMRKIKSTHENLEKLKTVISENVDLQEVRVKVDEGGSGAPIYKETYTLLSNNMSAQKRPTDPVQAAFYDFIMELKKQKHTNSYALQLERICPTNYTEEEYFTLATFIITNYTVMLCKTMAQDSYLSPRFPTERVPAWYRKNTFPDYYKNQIKLIVQKALENFVYQVVVSKDLDKKNKLYTLTLRLSEVLPSFDLSFDDIVKDNPIHIFYDPPVIEDAKDLISKINNAAVIYLHENGSGIFAKKKDDPNMKFANKTKELISANASPADVNIALMLVIVSIIQFRLAAYNSSRHSNYDKSFYKEHLGVIVQDMGENITQDLLPYKLFFTEQINLSLRELWYSILEEKSYEVGKALSLKCSLDLFCEKFAFKISDLDDVAQKFYRKLTEIAAQQTLVNTVTHGYNATTITSNNNNTTELHKLTLH